MRTLKLSICLSSNFLLASIVPEASILLCPLPNITVLSSITSPSRTLVNGPNLQFYPQPPPQKSAHLIPSLPSHSSRMETYRPNLPPLPNLDPNLNNAASPNTPFDNSINLNHRSIPNYQTLRIRRADLRPFADDAVLAYCYGSMGRRELRAWVDDGVCSDCYGEGPY